MAITINGNGTITGVTSGAGKVLQVVQTVKQDSFSASVSENNFSAITGLSASITPSSTSSKILVMFSVMTSMEGTNGTPGIVLYRNGSALSGARGTSGSYNLTAFCTMVYATNLPGGNVNFQYLDSPSSTSQQTYQCYLGSDQSGNYQCGVNRTRSGNQEGAASSITLMEIQG